MTGTPSNVKVFRNYKVNNCNSVAEFLFKANMQISLERTVKCPPLSYWDIKINGLLCFNHLLLLQESIPWVHTLSILINLLTSLYPYRKLTEITPLEKINAYSLISPYFSCFFANGENATKSKETLSFCNSIISCNKSYHHHLQIKAGNAEYFKQVKICGMTFRILWMKSQFQPDFTENFFH